MSTDRQDPPLARQIEKLKKINASLIARVEHVHDGQPNAFALFESAATVERQVRHQTEDLRQALQVLERSNDTLQQAKRMAEEASALKTTFLASVSHDLLQPLHAARLALSVLTAKEIAPSGEKLIAQADRSLRTLEDIIKTLLDLSKLDAGVSKPDMRNISAANLIGELCGEFAPAAAQRGLRFRQRGMAIPVYTDPLMMRRILQNLMSNAIRYTKKGGVLLSCTPQAEYLRIDIADTGPGIEKERMRVIFDEFERGDPLAGDEAGFGLGLAIVRRLAHAMGHEIKLWSRPGFGSVFSILIPRSRADETIFTEEARTVSATFEGAQILFLSEDESIFETVVPILETWGCDISLSASLEAAIACLQKAERAPDLLIAAPRRNERDEGMNTVKALRIEAEFSVPAILLGVAVEPGRDVQAVETLSLPLKPAELRALMAHMLQPVV